MATSSSSSSSSASAETSCKDALSRGIATCIAASAAIGHVESKESHPLSVLRKDFLALLALLRASSTKISLALKPTRLEFSAAISPINDTSAHIAAIAHCTSLFVPTDIGASLSGEVQQTAKALITASGDLLKHCLQVLSNEAAQPEKYLRLTGSLHELIDQATATLSLDNRAAVAKLFHQNRALITDAIGDLEELASDNNVNSDEDEIDDGWDELGLGSSEKMTEDGLVRAKKVHITMRLVSTLLERLAKDYLSSSSISVTPALLDPFVVRSTELSASADELVAVLEPPQRPGDIREELTSLQAQLKSLQQDLHTLSGDPSEGLQALSLDTTTTTARTSEWYETCFKQIYKGIRASLDLLPLAEA